MVRLDVKEAPKKEKRKNEEGIFTVVKEEKNGNKISVVGEFRSRKQAINFIKEQNDPSLRILSADMQRKKT